MLIEYHISFSQCLKILIKFNINTISMLIECHADFFLFNFEIVQKDILHDDS